MTQETAQRSPQSPAVTRSGLRLVYSRDWPKERRMRAIARYSVQPMQPRRAKRKPPTGIVAPIVWIGDKMLKFMHIR